MNCWWCRTARNDYFPAASLSNIISQTYTIRQTYSFKLITATSHSGIIFVLIKRRVYHWIFTYIRIKAYYSLLNIFIRTEWLHRQSLHSKQWEIQHLDNMGNQWWYHNPAIHWSSERKVQRYSWYDDDWVIIGLYVNDESRRKEEGKTQF